MIKSILYKEWIKTRWASLGALIAFILMLVYIYLNTAYYFRFYGASAVWYDVTIRNFIFFGKFFIYVPIFAGALIGLTQYIPEISANRLKLTLHLPLKENKILLTLIGYGSSILVLIYIISNITLAIITLDFFPVEVMWAVLITSLPWYIAGMVAYWSIAIISIEPKWFNRIVLFMVFVAFINLLFYTDFYNKYINSFIEFFLLSLIFAIQIFYTVHRFRRGVNQ